MNLDPGFVHPEAVPGESPEALMRRAAAASMDASYTEMADAATALLRFYGGLYPETVDGKQAARCRKILGLLEFVKGRPSGKADRISASDSEAEAQAWGGIFKRSMTLAFFLVVGHETKRIALGERNKGITLMRTAAEGLFIAIPYADAVVLIKDLLRTAGDDIGVPVGASGAGDGGSDRNLQLHGETARQLIANALAEVGERFGGAERN